MNGDELQCYFTRALTVRFAHPNHSTVTTGSVFDHDVAVDYDGAAAWNMKV